MWSCVLVCASKRIWITTRMKSLLTDWLDCLLPKYLFTYVDGVEGDLSTDIT